MQNRVQYKRPQGMLWSRNQGTLIEGLYVPDNSEYGSDAGIEDFIVLTDHNRGPINFDIQRIENRKRMINGTMRSYHIADKLTISTSWNMLPSRAFNLRPGFSSSAEINTGTEMYTSDGGAGGEEMLRWYNDNTGPIWVFLAYDRYTNFGDDNDAYAHLNQYNEIVQMYITSFDYSVEKRGGENHDLWNVSVTLEEV
jgi:hypothetical protein